MLCRSGANLVQPGIKRGLINRGMPPFSPRSSSIPSNTNSVVIIITSPFWFFWKGLGAFEFGRWAGWLGHMVIIWPSIPPMAVMRVKLRLVALK